MRKTYLQDILISQNLMISTKTGFYRGNYITSQTYYPNRQLHRSCHLLVLQCLQYQISAAQSPFARVVCSVSVENQSESSDILIFDHIT